MVIVTKYDWMKDALMPLTIALGIISALLADGLGATPGSVERALADGDAADLTALAWLIFLALSCLSSGIGAILRHYQFSKSVLFELPGSICAVFGIAVYIVAIFIMYGLDAQIALPASISMVLGVHFLFRVIALIATVRLEQKAFGAGRQ